MANAQAAAAGNDEQATGAAGPVKTFKQGGVEVSVWRNSGEQGDMYNATIRKTPRVRISCWIVTLGCDRLRPRSPLPAFGAMEQKTRLTVLRTPSPPTPAELECGLKGKRDYVTVALLVDCALRRQELAELEIETIQQREGR